MAIIQYPGTNFHDLNLDWMLEQIKTCLSEWNTVKGDWTDTQEDWEQLQTYVQNYFANLDVSQEISDKINQLIASGDFLTIIKSTVETQAASTTSAWITENLSQETGYVIDKSLAVGNAAADAEITGKLRSYAETSLFNLGRPNIMTSNIASFDYNGVTIALNNNILELSGTSTTTIRIKVSGVFHWATSVSSSWRTDDPKLSDGHEYVTVVSTLGGSITNKRVEVGWYDNSSGSAGWAYASSNLGEVAVSKPFTYDADGTHPAFLAVYMTSGAAMTDLKLRIDVIDITASNNVFSNGLLPNAQYIPYIGQTLGKINLAGTGLNKATVSNVDIVKRGNVITLNGSASAGGRVKISGDFDANGFVQDAWRAETPTLTVGRRYRISATVLGGTYTAGSISVPFYNADRYDLEAVLFTNDGETATAVNGVAVSKDVIYDGTNMNALCLYFSSSTVVEDLAIMVDVIDVDTISKEITALATYYYEDDYINDRIADVQTLRGTAGIHNVQFAWFTDPHYYHMSALNKLMAMENGMQSMQIINYIKQRTNTRMAICGGDMLRGNSMTKAICRSLFSDVRAYLGPIYDDLFMVIGNHEYNNQGSNGPNQLTSAEVYDMLCKHQELHIDSLSSVGDYTYTLEGQDARFIMIGCDRSYSIFNATLTWLSSVLAANTKANIVIISHIGLQNQETPEIATAFGSVATIIDNFNSRVSPFGSATGKICCVLSGHVHWDGNATTTGGVPVISTTCDRGFIADDDPDVCKEIRKPGMIGEQAVDYVLIDFDNKSIDMIRFGGSILNAAYDSNTQLIYDTDVGTGTEYTGTEWVIASTHKDRHFTWT